MPGRASFAAGDPRGISPWGRALALWLARLEGPFGPRAAAGQERLTRAGRCSFIVALHRIGSPPNLAGIADAALGPGQAVRSATSFRLVPSTPELPGRKALHCAGADGLLGSESARGGLYRRVDRSRRA